MENIGVVQYKEPEISITNFVSVPYEEFQTLTHHSALVRIAYDILNDDEASEYYKIGVLCKLFGLKDLLKEA